MAKKKFQIPEGIEKEAADYIKRVVLYLEKNNQFDDVDTAALTMLARNYSLFITTSKDIIENGILAKGSRNNAIPNPAIKIANDAQIQAVKIMEKFGLTAKDRKKLIIGDDEEVEDSPLMQFIKSEKKELR